MQNLKENLTVAGLTGLVGYAGSIYLNGGSSQTSYFNGSSTYDSNLVNGVSIGAASLVGGYISDYVSPMISSSSLINNAYLPSLMKPSIVGLTSLGTMSLAASYNPAIQNQSKISQFALGAGSQLVGSYINEKFISPTLKM